MVALSPFGVKDGQLESPGMPQSARSRVAKCCDVMTNDEAAGDSDLRIALNATKADTIDVFFFVRIVERNISRCSEVFVVA